MSRENEPPPGALHASSSKHLFSPKPPSNSADETAHSTRGPIPNRSYGSLVDLDANRKKSGDVPQRPHIAIRRTSETLLRRDEDEDLELGKAASHPTFNLAPPDGFPLMRTGTTFSDRHWDDNKRPSVSPSVLATMRSQRLIGNSNPRYRWEQYYKSEDELKQMKKPIRKYYERNNYLIQQYLYIDRLLDSSLPHNLIQEYQEQQVSVPPTINEDGTVPPTINEDGTPISAGPSTPNESQDGHGNGNASAYPKLKRGKNLYKLDDEESPLLQRNGSPNEAQPVPVFQPEEETDSNARVVIVAIYLNLAANILLLVLKIIIVALTSSLSLLASLVDGALDLLATLIIWSTTRLISKGHEDVQSYPIGRARLGPLGVLVFSVIMITSFVQVGIEAIQRLSSPNHEIVQLSTSSIVIMATTVIVKFLCWLWSRLINNSSVQALAQDSKVDVVFNISSIFFPVVGYYASLWFLDSSGALILSLYVIASWSLTSREHIANLSGRACSADERNILLYLTMRFAHTIEKIQNIQAYHVGDKINVEVDIVLDSAMSLRDSHDLGESLQYVLESVPGVERSFVHTDYKSSNLPSHMRT